MVSTLRPSPGALHGALADDLGAVLRPIDAARGLPNRVYTDPDLFAFERDTVLARTWTAICFASDLPEPGFALPVEFMGLPLLVVRDRAGELRVMHNVCRHRGMRLVGASGPVRTVLRCPYHSWAYDLDGRLLRTPHVGGADVHRCAGFDPAGHRLAPVRFDVWLGVVFVNLSGDAPPLADALRPLTERWAPLTGKDGLALFQAAPDAPHTALDVLCNWKLPVENYCEAYHLPYVHPRLNRTSPLGAHYNICIDAAMSGQGSRSYRATQIDGVRLPALPGWPADRPLLAEYISLYPNLLLGLQSDHAFAMILLPVEASRTIERVELTFVGEGATHSRYAACRAALNGSWRRVFEEDVSAVEGMQAGRASPGFDGGVFTPVQDVPTHHFHRWVATAYAGALARDPGEA